jgi:hypothetical protein
MATEAVEFMRDRSYPFHVEHTLNGWGRSGFDKSITEVKARKVDSGQVQVEIKITEYKGDRAYTRHGSLDLSPELQAQLLAVLI